MREEKINYSFTAMPTNFIHMMDTDCYMLMALLLSTESFWAAKGRLENGWFYKSIDEISSTLGRSLSSRKDTSRVIEALYRRKLIDVKEPNGKKLTLQFKVNHDEIKRIAAIPINDILAFNDKIERLSRDEPLTYNRHKNSSSETENKAVIETNCPAICLEKSPTTLESLEGIEEIKDNNIILDKSNIIDFSAEHTTRMQDSNDTTLESNSPSVPPYLNFFDGDGFFKTFGSLPNIQWECQDGAQFYAQNETIIKAHQNELMRNYCSLKEVGIWYDMVVVPQLNSVSVAR